MSPAPRSRASRSNRSRSGPSGELDLRGFLGLGDDVPPGYEAVDYDVRIKGDGTREQYEEIHQTVMATSPNYFNMSRPIRMNGTLSVG